MVNVFETQSKIDLSTFSVKDILLSHITSIPTAICILCYIIYQCGRPFTQRFFFLPPTDYRDTLKVALDKPNGNLPIGKIGVKKSSYRRRLIMGTSKPQSCSTLPLNSIDAKGETVNNLDSKYYKLHVPLADRKDEESRYNFLINIKPIDVHAGNRRKLIGFFHPFSYASGGGEKVLWEAVISTLESDINNIAVIYTFTPTTSTSAVSILENVDKTFGIKFLSEDRPELRDRIVFIHLPDKYQWLINGVYFKFLSIISQAIGSIILVLIGFYQLVPDIFIDTMGVPFSYSIVFGFFDIPIISYIHYPTVSRDMLNAAKNMGSIYGLIKYCYWWVLLKLYSINIMCVDTALYNSTWTCENVLSAIGMGKKKEEVDDVEDDILYPPCVSYDDERFEKITVKKLMDVKRDRTIVYLAQFRPEKRHKLLIKHYKEYLNKLNELGNPNIQLHKLIFIGSVREGKDEKYINELKELVREFEIDEKLIKFELNAPTETVENYLEKSDYGINCMWKEHFGIAVVEYMFNGAIPLVHASAGPFEDIVIPRIDGKILSRKERNKTVKLPFNSKSGLFFKDETDPDYNKSITEMEKYPTLTEMLLSASVLGEDEKKILRENAIYVSRERFGKGVFPMKWHKYITEIVDIETSRRSVRGKVERLY
ncbi:alpha-1,2-mannosyltransferase [Pichia kluyveri]|uniref:GDP-Man:Man(3)GlcNAc(2)-PP-Dol alpha-1,2-mannosyltransferase n=1 Tax=Pichia kluyveri TaxID=36015 RepID=A0AAV5R9R8_PICKL|nr:alpha-1,2-mannosyltransferase [Pichia kluyveri]